MKPTPVLLALALLFPLPLARAQETLKITPVDGDAGDGFGGKVALSGSTLLVGAPGDGSSTGSVYVIDPPTASVGWTDKLWALGGGPADRFGNAIAISGNTILVGASGHDGGASNTGSAYIFDLATKQQLSMLLAGDRKVDDHFGTSVAISGDTALVGAVHSPCCSPAWLNGAAYLFDVSNPSAPLQTAKLEASDGASGGHFGHCVAISGDLAVVGALYGSPPPTSPGAVYLYDISNPSLPVETAKLIASDGQASDNFGSAVAISGTTLVVGAYDADGIDNNSGAAYLFDVSDPFNPAERAKMVAQDGETGDDFGLTVALSGDVVIVGAAGDGFNHGAAYMFSIANPSHPVQVAKLLASDSAVGDRFGCAVAIDGATTIVGAYDDDDSGSDSGAAYLFSLASWSSRGGILGLNPADFSCAGAPVMGATWSTTVATAPSLGSSTLSTFVAMGVGGATQGIPVFGHELLILPPFLSFAGSGAHDFPVPTDPALAGLSQSWQGGRLEQGTGLFLVLTNALDVVYGL